MSEDACGHAVSTGGAGSGPPQHDLEKTTVINYAAKVLHEAYKRPLDQANSMHSSQPDRPSAATGDLFFYVTLIVEQVIRVLLDRVPAHEPVIARGWRVAQLPDRLYPGLVHDGGHVPGRLYTDLTTREWATLDAFEDPTYTLTTIEVLPGPRPALAYIWPDEPLFDAWTVDTFSPTDLAIYLNQCRAWRQCYEQDHNVDDH